MQPVFLRHTPADLAAMPGLIASARRELDEASRENAPTKVLDAAGNLVALLTAGRREAEARSIGLAFVPLARAHLELEESAWLLHHLSTAAQYAGCRQQANELFAEALRLTRDHGWRRLEHLVLHHWARSRVEEGHLDEAVQMFLESRGIRAELCDPLVASSERALSELAKIRRGGDAA